MSDKSDDLDKLVGELERSQEDEKGEVVDELVSLVNQGEVEVPGLLRSLLHSIRSDDKVMEGAADVCRKLIPDTDLISHLISEENGMDQKTAMKLLNEMGGNASEYLSTTSKISEKIKSLEKLGLRTDRLEKKKEEAVDTYVSGDFEQGLSKLHKILEEVDETLKKGKKLKNDIRSYEKDISFLESYDVKVKSFQKKLERVKKDFQEGELRIARKDFNKFKEKIDEKKKLVLDFKDRREKVRRGLKKSKKLGIDVKDIEKQVKDMTFETEDGKLEGLLVELRFRFKKESRKMKIERAARDSDLFWTGTQPTGAVEDITIGTLGEEDVVVCASEDSNVYVWKKDGDLLWIGKEPNSAVISVSVEKRWDEVDMVIGTTKGGNIYIWNKEGDLLLKETGPKSGMKNAVRGELGGKEVLVAGSTGKHELTGIYVWQLFDLKKIRSNLIETKKIIPCNDIEEKFYQIIDSIKMDPKSKKIELGKEEKIKLKRIEEKINRRRWLAERNLQQMEKLREEIEELAEIGLEPSELFSKVDRCEEALERRSIGLCNRWMKEVESELERIKHTVRPKLEVEFVQEKDLETNTWTVVQLKIKNTGDINAVNVVGELDGEIKVQGELKVNEIQRGSSAKVDVHILSTFKGNNPVKIKTGYEGALERKEYLETHQATLLFKDHEESTSKKGL